MDAKCRRLIYQVLDTALPGKCLPANIILKLIFIFQLRKFDYQLELFIQHKLLCS